MEMSNNFMPELHVAQQQRRDKLRVQHIDELQQLSSFDHLHNSNSNTTTSSMMMLLPAPEMLSFGSASNSFPNIHPTRFVTPSSSDSCDPQQQPMPPPSCDDNWVQRHVSPSVPQFLIQTQSHPHELHDYQSNNNVHQSWGINGGNNELPLLPSNFVNHANDVGSHPHGHGLSLSLSSNQLCEYRHLGGDPRELKPFESGSISSVVKQSMSGAGSSIQVHRNVGPLGPFTGYAAILKSSKFLKPAQLMLDEFFSAAGLWRGGEDVGNDQSLAISRSRNVGDCSTVVASKMDGSNELSCKSSSCESYRPDCHERKAKLLHMQEEVCKRHKQYHQQMQMVISAFDSVPGLSNATPYISRSIKTISRHFRCLKNAIADQLKHIKRALGEDLTSPTSFLRSDSSSSLRYDQNFVKVRSGAIGGTGHVGHQSHVWRPQRGLPERAVSILRAWLFDHFLHPYPTDNDKQMLATQTGLTRNQVSNWFINARVRLWKPMVEEIHMLETKGSSRSESNSNNSVMSIIEKNRQATAANQSGCKSSPLNPVCDKQLECLGPSSSLERSRGEPINTEQLFQNQKCSRLESHQVPTSIDSSFIGFLPYQRRGLELGGIGAVSLTLGLRHGSETTQQQLQHQFIPQGMPFGGHVIHDFSG
uniref:Homeobox domain-containing protein n=1 Tax=Chenopodium quinoa TaxID=63459 RepID=A0A803M3H1_CHEQI